MPGGRHVLVVDQGTTSTRAILFDATGRPKGVGQQELRQHFPRPGWVEHDAEEIWRATQAVGRAALRRARVRPGNVAAIGITNQRETVVLWDRRTGKPLHRAIVWQDRRTAADCERLASSASLVTRRTGLLLDPYFSATKIAWLLKHVPRARRGDVACGTIDSFLVWKLTGGAVHATDATNASRTLLFDIHRQRWSAELCALFGVPSGMLPEVRDSSAGYGSTGAFGGEIPITGVAGDQQAAAIGQGCWDAGDVKCTYGTGAFLLLNTGERALRSRSKLLTTVAFRLPGRLAYALEGSIFSAGATVQWLRDGLGILRKAADSERLARASDPRREVVLVPAFVGLGAPWWDAHARGALLGLTRDTTAADVVRAALDAVAFQTADLLDAMAADGARRPRALRVDGGMVANDWFVQRLADLLGVPVERPVVQQTTALGAAVLAGLGPGARRLDRRFEPRMRKAERDERRAVWHRAVERVTARRRSA